jgi:hypothetical protein
MPPSRIGYSGPGFLLQFSDSTGMNFTTIALSKDIKGPTMQGGKYDTSTQDMGNRFRTFDPELVDPGTLTTTIIYRPEDATHAAAFAALGGGTYLDFQLYNNPPANTAYLSGSGFFTKFDVTAPVAGDMTADVEFQVSGEVVQN